MSPRTKEQNDVIREQRFRQIRAAAADVYLTRGTAFEIRDVALRAGVGYGTVYHYYNNKFTLLGDLLWEAFETARELTERSLPASAAPGMAKWEALERFAADLLALWAREPATFILYKMASEKFHQLPVGATAELQHRFEAELFEPIAAAFAGIVASRRAEEIASLLFGSLIGCAGLALYRGSPAPDAERTSRLLLAGIKQTASEREEN
ncbi:TetR/AcrR family transcriptional regulator [Cohnella fermenti]|uniref:TetR/AcrR family transcriptional regulator n=1 Tax=Cohnella fermenti TaxID=2565925 RepID=A0A4S4BUM6_9BACL|nr:TetR/AcrR family transcriptional regulator [Cohnella fermenti]THF78809.1 TetR/AcrR family transcriptional regulator [Cohnella fermenti]